MRFDSDCSIQSNFPASLLVQMKTFGAYFSVAFSVTQPEDAGAVGVGVGVALGDADSLARGVVDEAAVWPPHAVADTTKMTAAAAPPTRF
jgi:hypothetical protein